MITRRAPNILQLIAGPLPAWGVDMAAEMWWHASALEPLQVCFFPGVMEAVCCSTLHIPDKPLGGKEQIGQSALTQNLDSWQEHTECRCNQRALSCKAQALQKSHLQPQDHLYTHCSAGVHLWATQPGGEDRGTQAAGDSGRAARSHAGHHYCYALPSGGDYTFLPCLSEMSAMLRIFHRTSKM